MSVGECNFSIKVSLVSTIYFFLYGSNFSVGESQLFCLCRALLDVNNKILIIDEATSNVDSKTDNLIQTIFKKYLYKNKTVLTIAHRLQTILDSDKILVLNYGKLMEFDTPKNLLNKSLNNPNAFFKKMYHQTIQQIKINKE